MKLYTLSKIPLYLSQTLPDFVIISSIQNQILPAASFQLIVSIHTYSYALDKALTKTDDKNSICTAAIESSPFLVEISA